MKRSVLFLFLFCLIYTITENQLQGQLWKMRRYEVSAGLGPSFFFGDIGGFSKTKNILGFRDMSFLQTRFNVNVNLKYRITRDINVRLSGSFGSLHSTDERGSNEKRDYEAKTSFFEPVLIGEYYFIKNRAENSYLFEKGRSLRFSGIMSAIDFYAFTGLGGLKYTIKGNDNLIAHGFEPGGFTAIIPVGVGSTLVFSPNFNFGIELGGRYSFSDNIDGYTSQFSSSNDVYYFLNFTVAYKLRTGTNGLPTFRR
jgi:hypothetical protein